LFALPGALALVDPRLARPPGIDTPMPAKAGSSRADTLPALAARWRVHREQAAELLSESVVDALAARLRRHLRPALHDPSQAISGSDG
jgi:hypothetical protein